MSQIKCNHLSPSLLWDLRSGPPLPDPVYHRAALAVILNRLERPVIEVILGPRQAGKTTLMNLLIRNLVESDVPAESLFYLNLDLLADIRFLSDPQLFLRSITDAMTGAGLPAAGRGYVFLDEIQRLPEPGLFLKGLYDAGSALKIFVSGSASLDLRARIKEYLPGRQHETQLLPLSMKEIVQTEIPQLPVPQGNIPSFKNDGYWKELDDLYGTALQKVVLRHIVSGGYPAVHQALSQTESLEILQELFTTYVQRDIMSWLRLGQAGLFNDLVRVLASQVGNLLRVQEICSLLGGSRATVGKYIDILEQTYIIFRLRPLSFQARDVLRRMPKCYFMDTGLRNFALRDMSSGPLRADWGALVENAVLMEIIKGIGPLEEIFFWRTKAGAEVDFIVRQGRSLVPIEVKAGDLAPGTLPRGLHSFLGRTLPETAYVINKSSFGIFKKDKTTVFIIPLHWLPVMGPWTQG